MKKIVLSIMLASYASATFSKDIHLGIFDAVYQTAQDKKVVELYGKSKQQSLELSLTFIRSLARKLDREQKVFLVNMLNKAKELAQLVTPMSRGAYVQTEQESLKTLELVESLGQDLSPFVDLINQCMADPDIAYAIMQYSIKNFTELNKFIEQAVKALN